MNASKTNQSQETKPHRVGLEDEKQGSLDTTTTGGRVGDLNKIAMPKICSAKMLEDKTSDTKLTMCEHIEIKGGHCVACMEEGKLAFAKVSSNYSVGYKDGRVSRIKEFKEILEQLNKKFEKELGGSQ